MGPISGLEQAGKGSLPTNAGDLDLAGDEEDEEDPCTMRFKQLTAGLEG